MKRHLKIGIAIAPNGQKYGWIIDQTHIGIAFTKDGKNFIHKDFRICSIDYPEVRTDRLLVQGHMVGLDTNVFNIPSEKWLSKLRAAVRAYNQQEEEGKSQPEGYEVIE